MTTTTLTDRDALVARVSQYEAVLSVALAALAEIRNESAQHQERLVLARMTLGCINEISEKVLNIADRLGIDAPAAPGGPGRGETDEATA